MKNKKIRINWRGIGDSNELSINEYVEKNSDKLKSEFFNFIRNINYNSFSFNYNEIDLWDLSLTKELSHYKTPQLNTIIKVIALIEIVRENKFETIEILNLEKNLQNKLKSCFKNSNVKLKYSKNIDNEKLERIRIPQIVRVFWFLIKFIYTNYYFMFKKPFEFKESNTILLSYFTHITSSKNKPFKSKIWTNLSEILKNKNITSNYLSIYLPTKEFPSSKKTFKYISYLNEKNLSKHYILQSYISFKDLFKLLGVYIRLCLKYNLNYSILSKKYIYKNHNLLPFFKSQINRSLIGDVLFENLIWIECFKNFYNSLRKKTNIIFTQENQSWEIPFLIFHKKTNKGLITAYQNQFVRKWDLRYYYKFNKDSIPDYFLVTSQTAYDFFLNYGYPKRKINKVEYLRNKKNNQISLNELPLHENGILILGDYIEADTNQTIHNLAPLVLNKNFYLGFKPHPAKEIDKNLIDKYKIKLETSEINNLIKKYKYFICTNSSGSSIDILLNNKLPLIYNPDYQLNNSPISNLDKIILYNKENLFEKLRIIDSQKDTWAYNALYVSENFSRWNIFIDNFLKNDKIYN